MYFRIFSLFRPTRFFSCFPEFKGGVILEGSHSLAQGSVCIYVRLSGFQDISRYIGDRLLVCLYICRERGQSSSEVVQYANYGNLLRASKGQGALERLTVLGRTRANRQPCKCATRSNSPLFANSPLFVVAAAWWRGNKASNRRVERPWVGAVQATQTRAHVGQF